MFHLTFLKRSIRLLPVPNLLSKNIFILLLALPFGLIAAQENSSAAPTQQDDQEIERIEVEGRAGDSALQAFNSGNFALAEIEFKKNAKCALRAERNLQASINSFQNSQISQSLQSTAGNANTQNGSVSNTAGNSAPSTGKVINRTSKNKSILKARTCENRGFQMYMIGLTQLQLGRPTEAEEALRTAVFLNRNLYDAYYRLALIEFLRENKEEGEELFEDIQVILSRCRDCEAKGEIIARIDFLQNVIDGKVKLR
ncbi:hypothetical protein [Paraglaciecola sp.]|uniref:hypothetical protein n=1 Tax=Paraglaciecola sp. TaxID=1920173 RepID=UPI003EF39185